MNGYAEIDIASQRRSRAKPAMTNTLARQRLELFRQVYSGEPVYPANTLLENGKVKTPGRQHYLDTQQAVINSLQKRGIV